MVVLYMVRGGVQYLVVVVELFLILLSAMMMYCCDGRSIKRVSAYCTYLLRQGWLRWLIFRK